MTEFRAAHIEIIEIVECVCVFCKHMKVNYFRLDQNLQIYPAKRKEMYIRCPLYSFSRLLIGLSVRVSSVNRELALN